MTQLCLWTKIRTKQWLVLCASLFYVCVRVFCASNATILIVYIPAKIKMSFIWKDNCFCCQKSAFSISRSVTIFPSVVQAYTAPYSFGGRIKLIICQIRHELSATIHQISISWKKTLYGRPNSISFVKWGKKLDGTSTNWDTIKLH